MASISQPQPQIQANGPFIPAHWRPAIANAAAALNLVPVGVGLYGIFGGAHAVNWALNALEFPPLSASASSSDARLVSGLVRMYAVRQFALGGAGLCAWFYGAHRVMGLASLGTGIWVGLVDGLVANEVAGKVVWGHWVAVPLGLFFGGSLLGYL